jgi:putative PIN family toxin of toxin-antitoxin system
MTILVVLDTNVVVSAGINPRGAPAAIVDAALAGLLIPVVCPDIVDEYQRVVQRPRFQSWDFPPRWLEVLIATAHHVDQPLIPWPLAGPDADDLVFLALAHHTGAALITGNLAHFPQAIRRGVTVIEPRAYLEARARA